MNRKKAETLWQGMTDLDEELLKEALEESVEPEGRRLSPLRLVVAAACICLVVGSVLAATGGFTRITRMFTHETLEPGSDLVESGYDVAVEVRKIPVKELTGAVIGVSESIVAQYRDYKLWDSWSPGLWQQTFSTAQEAAEFIGYRGLQSLSWNLREQEAIVRVYGSPQGDLEQISVESRYQVQNLRLQATATIYTQHHQGEVVFGTRTTEEQSYEESTCTTGAGLVCHMVTSTPLESGYAGTEGYVVAEGVLYHLHIAHLEKDRQTALELVRQWAELFAEETE